MKLVLFRHGIAVEREQFILNGKEDMFRPLTNKGREKTLKMAKLLKKCFENNFDFVVSSPHLRAIQTSEILLDVFKINEIHECSELVPSAPPQAFSQWLKRHAKDATQILAVGHEPQMSDFASWALAGSSVSFIQLKKAGVLSLEVESFEEIYAKSAQLEWLLPPKLF